MDTKRPKFWTVNRRDVIAAFVLLTGFVAGYVIPRLPPMF